MAARAAAAAAGSVRETRAKGGVKKQEVGNMVQRRDVEALGGSVIRAPCGFIDI